MSVTVPVTGLAEASTKSVTGLRGTLDLARGRPRKAECRDQRSDRSLPKAAHCRVRRNATARSASPGRPHRGDCEAPETPSCIVEWLGRRAGPGRSAQRALATCNRLGSFVTQGARCMRAHGAQQHPDGRAFRSRVPDGRRCFSLRQPRPDTEALLRTPRACGQCMGSVRPDLACRACAAGVGVLATRRVADIARSTETVHRTHDVSQGCGWMAVRALPCA